jgi:hypothetical protein
MFGRALPIALFALFALLAAAGSAAAAPPPGPLTDARLMQITLPAKDLARAVAFYRDVLGVKFLFQVKGAAFLDAGGVRLRLEEVSAAPWKPDAARGHYHFASCTRAGWPWRL